MRIVFVAIISVLFLSSCFNNIKEGEGDPQKFQRTISDFTKIKLNIPAELYVMQGAEYSCTIETHPNLENYFNTDVKDQELTISSKGNFTSQKLDIYITMPFVEQLSLQSSGNIYCKNEISNKDLNLIIDGSGNISLNKIVIRNLKGTINGSGNIKLVSGNAMDAVYSISGSGGIEADNIDCKSIKADISGSGNIACYVAEDLDVSISGSGSLKYKGQPKVKEKVTGSGKVSSF